MCKIKVFTKRFTASELPRFFTANQNLLRLRLLINDADKLIIRKKNGGYLIRRQVALRRYTRIFTHDFRQAEAAIRHFFRDYHASSDVACRVQTSDDYNVAHWLNLMQFAEK